MRELTGGGDGTRLTLEMPSLAQIGPVLEAVATRRRGVLDFSLHTANLADAFVALTGTALGDGPGR